MCVLNYLKHSWIKITDGNIEKVILYGVEKCWDQQFQRVRFLFQNIMVENLQEFSQSMLVQHN